MSDITCKTLTQFFLWITSIGEKHHCAVVERPKKSRAFVNPKNFYPKHIIKL